MHRGVHHGERVIDSVCTGMNGNGCSGWQRVAVSLAPAGRSGTFGPDHSAVPGMRSLRCPVSRLTRRVMIGHKSGAEHRVEHRR